MNFQDSFEFPPHFHIHKKMTNSGTADCMIVCMMTYRHRCKLGYFLINWECYRGKQFRDFPARPNVKYLLILDWTFCANKFTKISTATTIIDLARFESVIKIFTVDCLSKNLILMTILFQLLFEHYFWWRLNLEFG